MNRFMLIALLLFVAAAANSQITKGNWMLGGVLSYASTNYHYKSPDYEESYSSYKIYIKPNVGYFFIDKLSAGLKAGIDITGDKGSGQSYTDFNVGPYLRYYLLKPEKLINIITEAGYWYGFEKSSTSGKTSKNTFGFSAGPVVYFNNVVGLEMLVSYSTYQFSGIKGNNNTIMVGLGLQVHLEKSK